MNETTKIGTTYFLKREGSDELEPLTVTFEYKTDAEKLAEAWEDFKTALLEEANRVLHIESILRRLTELLKGAEE